MSKLKKIIESFPKLSRFYRNIRDLLDKNQPSILTPWGFTIAGHADMASGNFEPNETKLFRELLKEVDLFINVGANIGYYCCHALSLNKQVIAIEPIQRNLHYLLRNIDENGWAGQIEIFPLAVGSKTDILKIWGGGTGASLLKGWANIPASYFTQVPILTLDRILAKSINGKRTLILVDIEGAEYSMLQGAKETLKSNPRPIWMVEINSTEHQPQNVRVNPNLISTFETFFKYGYTSVCANELQNSVSINDVRLVFEGEQDFIVNNFIFR